MHNRHPRRFNAPRCRARKISTLNEMDHEDRKETRHAPLRQTQFNVRELAEMNLPSVALKPFSRDLNTGQIDFQTWAREACFFSESIVHNPIANHRTSATAEAYAEIVALHRYTGGGSKGYFDDKPVIRKPGGIYLLDLGLSWEGIRDPGMLESVYIPKKLIGYESGRDPGFISIERSHRLQRLIGTHLNDVFGPYRDAEDSIFKPMFNQLLACVKMAINMPVPYSDIRGHLREEMFRTICDFIEANLESPELSTTTILNNHGVSRASLYRMFEPHGGVRNYITECRALRAVFDLAGATGQHGHVRAIGEKWGFSNPVEFNRTIRRLFDSSPGALFDPTNADGSQAVA